MTLRLKTADGPRDVRTESRRGAIPRRPYVVRDDGRRLYLGPEVVATFAVEWTGPTEPAGWPELPSLEVP